MKRNHLQLLNAIGTGQGVYKYNVLIRNNDDIDEEESVENRDYRRQRTDFLRYYTSYNSQYRSRVQNRDSQLVLNHYDYIVIWTYQILSDWCLSEELTSV